MASLRWRRRRLPEPVEAHDPHEISQERLLALISVMIALTGIGIGWFLFQRQPLMQMPATAREQVLR
jgi:hypothetical protein